MTKEEFLSELSRRSNNFGRAGRAQELAYWIGSSLAAVCSAIAGHSIAANLTAWSDPYGRIIAGALALVPAIWAALDRTLRLRQMSVFSYGVQVKLRALRNKALSLDLPDKERGLMDEYSAIMTAEHDDFTKMILGHDETDAQAQRARAVEQINDAKEEARRETAADP